MREVSTPQELALQPFLGVDMPPDWSRISLPGVDLIVHGWPLAQVAHPTPDLIDVPASVEAVRKAARERGASSLIWWVTPDVDHLAAPLERAGLVNRNSVGFEQTENAMMLDTAPACDIPGDVEVTGLLSPDDVDAAHRVIEEAFGLPAGSFDYMRDAVWIQAQDPGYPVRRLVARLNGIVVGTALAGTAPSGLNLFGGAVVEAARGRGVYRALVARRWQIALERGTPALTVQAGRMSRPVLERLGFRLVGHVRVFDDGLLSAESVGVAHDDTAASQPSPPE